MKNNESGRQMFASLNQIIWCTLIVAGFAASTSANAATVQLSGTELIGASGVNVNGNDYSVRFVDGSCVSLFAECAGSGTYGFTFTSSADALAASQALLDQVLLGELDDSPSRTSGCNESNLCMIYTPYGITAPGGSVSIAVAANRSLFLLNLSNPLDDATSLSSVSPSLETVSTAPGGINDVSVYAVWALDTTNSVPEPAPLALVAAGILGALASRRRSWHRSALRQKEPTERSRRSGESDNTWPAE
jgi:hypothetical protein